jgi:hypothetical protein
MVLQSGGFKTERRCFKLPLSTGPKPTNRGQSKLLLAVRDCHLESRLASNHLEQQGINVRNSRSMAVSEQGTSMLDGHV